jgi:3-oxoacyl-[acyl-carrier protein] reductase
MTKRVLEGKTAIVTGGSLGIGAAIARELGEAGAKVALNYRRHADEADKIVGEIERVSEAVSVQADVSKPADAEKLLSAALERFGGVDILVNNAGINRDRVVWKMSDEEWDAVLDVNLKGYFNLIRAVAPVLKEKKSGRIINITSINGLRGKFGQANYSAAKAGIIGLTKAVAKELGRYGVTVNAVAPGMIETAMMRDLPEEVKETAKKEAALGKIGKPEDVANLVRFLASDDAGHITGEVIKVDGGQYI